MTHEDDFLRMIKSFGILFNGRTEGDGTTTIQLREQTNYGVVQFNFDRDGTYTSFEHKE